MDEDEIGHKDVVDDALSALEAMGAKPAEAAHTLIAGGLIALRGCSCDAALADHLATVVSGIESLRREWFT